MNQPGVDTRVGTVFLAFLCGAAPLGDLRRALRESPGYDALAGEIDFMYEDVWRDAPERLVLDPNALVHSEGARRWAVRWLLWCHLHGDKPPAPVNPTLLGAFKSLATLFAKNPYEPFGSESELADGIDRVGAIVSARLTESPLGAWAPVTNCATLSDE